MLHVQNERHKSRKAIGNKKKWLPPNERNSNKCTMLCDQTHRYSSGCLALLCQSNRTLVTPPASTRIRGPRTKLWQHLFPLHGPTQEFCVLIQACVPNTVLSPSLQNQGHLGRQSRQKFPRILLVIFYFNPLGIHPQTIHGFLPKGWYFTHGFRCGVLQLKQRPKLDLYTLHEISFHVIIHRSPQEASSARNATEIVDIETSKQYKPRLRMYHRIPKFFIWPETTAYIFRPYWGEVNKTGIPQKSLIKARPRSAFHIHEQDDEETAAQKIIAHCIHSSKHRPKSAPPKVEVADSDQTVRQIPAPSDKQKQHKAPQNKRSFRTDKMENLEEGAREVVERQISYERALKKYGWRMEVPGDPFNLKSRFIPERMSYVIPYELTPSLPQPPVMRVNNKDTFFHTTIKILPLSFTIDPDFKSEFFVARKKALMSSGKWPYASRRYAFAY
ncbi:unnamed protein product [Calicophoron daubneyi]|uniref:Uncharacterized protein n=1 Tax=Calicophoron daubneyi TaxID=300641 RepID=A0AAV2TCQ2_CALDB